MWVQHAGKLSQGHRNKPLHILALKKKVGVEHKEAEKNTDQRQQRRERMDLKMASRKRRSIKTISREFTPVDY